MFSNCFDDWTELEFKQYIYNDRYIEVDPDYAEIRPRETAILVGKMFQKDKSRLRLLDYGGGNGVCGQLLRGSGFLTTEIYDPFTPQYARRPEGKFDVVICFETLEHLPNPMAGIASIIESTTDSGAVLFSTLLQPIDFEKHGMDWWYVGPRNGHISIFSRKSLALAWRHFGFKVASFNDGLHFAFRQIPDFARHIVK
jgi:SAM-dependent methyltransferase